MTFATKYNIGDKFWLMKDNRPTEMTVNSIYTKVWTEPTANYGTKQMIQVQYVCEFPYSPKHIVSEEGFYPTKAELLATL